MSSKKNPLTEDRANQLVRNALLVAGQEMGAEGDHWPVIKSTVKSLMETQENLKVERNVHTELKKQLYTQLAEMEKVLAASSKEDQAKYQTVIDELKDVFSAYFDDVDESQIKFENEDDKPAYLKRMKAIIETMEE